MQMVSACMQVVRMIGMKRSLRGRDQVLQLGYITCGLEHVCVGYAMTCLCMHTVVRGKSTRAWKALLSNQVLRMYLHDGMLVGVRPVSIQSGKFPQDVCLDIR
jgi:hypothetical protein